MQCSPAFGWWLTGGFILSARDSSNNLLYLETLDLSQRSYTYIGTVDGSAATALGASQYWMLFGPTSLIMLAEISAPSSSPF